MNQDIPHLYFILANALSNVNKYKLIVKCYSKAASAILRKTGWYSE